VVKTYEKAVQLLKIRPHHSGELSRKLLMRGFSAVEVQQTINQLKEQGMLNDDQFAQLFLESLIKYKSFGFYGLKSKLLQRGLASNDAERLLKENLSLDQEKEIAMKIVGKVPDLDRQKLAQKLSRKGFRTEVISQIINLDNLQ
jgi:regulatory protein